MSGAANIQQLVAWIRQHGYTDALVDELDRGGCLDDVRSEAYDEGLRDGQGDRRVPTRSRTKFDEGIELWREATVEPILAEDVYARGAEAGIPRRTLDRARSAIKHELERVRRPGDRRSWIRRAA